MQKRLVIAFAILAILTIIAYALMLNPTIQESVGWQLNTWLIRIRTWLNPPEQVAFSVEEQNTTNNSTGNFIDAMEIIKLLARKPLTLVEGGNLAPLFVALIPVVCYFFLYEKNDST